MRSVGLTAPDPAEASALGSVRRAIRRELHTLSQRPDLTWQQLHNRLQWAGPPLVDRLTEERNRRSRPGSQPWVHQYTPLVESEGLVRTLSGHADSVKSCAVSADGTRIVSASCDNTLKTWDAATGTEVLTLSGHTDWVTGCAMSPDGGYICSSSTDGTIRLWDTTTGQEYRSFAGMGLRACAIGPDGRWVVATTGTTKGSGLVIWDTELGGEIRRLTGHSEAVWGCAVDPAGRFVVSAGHDFTVKLWDPATGDQTATLEGHRGFVTGCAVSADGTLVASASHDHTVKLWKVATGGEVITFRGHREPVHSCAISPDGRYLLSASWDHTLKLWEIGTGQELTTLTGHTGYVEGCAFGPDGSWVVSAGGDNTLKIWDTTVDQHHPARIDRIEDVPFEEIYPGSGPVPEADPHQVASCAFASSGTWLVTASGDRTLRIWDPDSGKSIRALVGHTRAVAACAVGDGDQRIVSAGLDGTVRVWSPTTGKELRCLRYSRSSSPFDCAVSPDGAWLVASGSKGLFVADLSSGKDARALAAAGESFGCAVSPDARWVAAAGRDGILRTLEVSSGAVSNLFCGHTARVEGCAVSPDGTFVVSASADRTLRSWDPATGMETRSFIGHADIVNDCAISPDGSWVGSASSDGTVRVWNADTGATEATFVTSGAATAVAFHPSVPLLASGDRGGGVCFARLAGLEYGPLVVTAIGSAGSMSVRCPSCSDSAPIEVGRLGTELTCARVGCGTCLRVNSFALQPPKRRRGRFRRR